MNPHPECTYIVCLKNSVTVFHGILATIVLANSTDFTLLHCQCKKITGGHQYLLSRIAIEGNLESISSTFYANVFCTKFWRQKL